MPLGENTNSITVRQTFQDRVNEKRAEMTTTVFLPDGRVLFNFKRPAIEDHHAFDAGGMRFEVIEPGQKLTEFLRVPHILYAGDKNYIAPLDLMVKDLGLALDIAKRSDVDNAMGKLAGALYEQHQQAGNGEKDFSSILQQLQD